MVSVKRNIKFLFETNVIMIIFTIIEITLLPIKYSENMKRNKSQTSTNVCIIARKNMVYKVIHGSNHIMQVGAYLI